MVVKFDAKSSVASSCCNSEENTNYCRKYKPKYPHVLNNKLLDIMPKVFRWVGVAIAMIKYIYDYLLDLFQRRQRCSSTMRNYYLLRTLNLLSNIQDTKYEMHRQDPMSPASRATLPVVSHVM